MPRRGACSPQFQTLNVPGLYRGLLVGLLAWGALAFGGVYPWAYWPMVVVAATLGIWAMPVVATWRDRRVVVLGAALAAFAAGGVLQLVPLPPGVVAVLAPHAHDWLRAARFGLEPGRDWRPLSLAPGATAVALATFCGFGLLFLGLIRAIRHVGIPWLVLQVAGLGLGLAVLGIVQRLLTGIDETLVYGFWRPQHGGNPFGPFINRNHFAGWMAMALPVVVGYSLGLALQARRERTGSVLRWAVTEDAHRVLLLSAVGLAMGLALVLTGSRSGLAAGAVGLAVLALVMWRRLPSRAVRLAAGAYLLVLLGAAVGWAGVNPVVERFAPASRDLDSRMAAWRDTLAIVRDFQWTGVGLGAYGDAMLVYQTGPRDVIYLQAHNDYLQLAAEGGVLLGIPALVFIALLLRQVIRRLRSGDDAPVIAWIRAGAVGGLGAIAAQSLVEFSLQLPGNVVLFVVLLALAVHRPARPPAHAHRV